MNTAPRFDSLGIDPKILSILTKLGFVTATPIQAQAIPVLLTGKDIIGIAQTGTGKTLAFGIPLLQLSTAASQKLVVLPTRELALQAQEVMAKIARPLGLRSTVIIGGESMQRQLQEIHRRPHIIIGTPGRIVDHLQQRTLRLDRVSAVVLDEADRMLDMGFAPQLRQIMDAVPAKRQTMLFSATMPEDIVRIAQTYMALPIRVEIAPQGTPAERVTQEVFFVDKPNKSLLLEKMLVEYPGSVLLFSRTKHGARKLATMIRRWGHAAAEIHANRTLAQRKEALSGFKNGKYRVLVATDIAARGIDVKDISLVLNYDLPDNPSDYVHRIGRTGRAGGAGHAISFATPEQRRDVEEVEKLIRAVLPRKAHPDLPPVVMPTAPTATPARSGGRRGPRHWRGGRRPARRR